MLPLYLILTLSFFVFYSIRAMLKREHDLHALGFFLLYIYTIFAQIGYAYFPELSTLIGAYFGPMLFYKYWAFMFLSFVFAFLFYRVITRSPNRTDIYIVKPTRRNYGEYLFFAIAILLYMLLNLYFVVFRELFGYGGGNSAGGPWFGIAFWIYLVCTVILYTLVRDKSNGINKRRFAFILFVFYLIFFLQVSLAAGARSNIVYLFFGLAFYELSPIIRTIRFQKRKLLATFISAVLILSALNTLRELRLQGGNIGITSIFSSEISESQFSDQDLPTNILMQDYFNASHTLFVSMQYNIIDPLEVVKSNLANSLVKLKYPFITNTILDRGLGISNDRGVGWAYHLFVEGYNAMGMLGVFYNAIFWNLGMILWIRLAQSNDAGHNRAMLAIVAVAVALSIRGQLAGFIKFYWLILLPGLVLLLLANNSKIAFYKRRRRGD